MSAPYLRTLASAGSFHHNRHRMKEGSHIKIYHWLMPLAWLYGLGVRTRNKLFDLGVLRSRSFALPVICIGNITVGGTGKTPHTEYLIRLLSERMRVAVLSRGYKRKSHGFIIASDKATAEEIGDEPCQMKRKFPGIEVAVDTDRCHGIDMLTAPERKTKPDVILLDDAYQHRYVKAGLNILLMDFHRVTYKDRLLPAGRLREPHSGIARADIIIVTKCPKAIDGKQINDITMSLNLSKTQQLFFTRYAYPEHIDGISKRPVLLTGIASPRQMAEDLKHIVPDIELMSFPDHHNFTDADIEAIRRKTKGRTILTTEKDSTRIHGLENVVVVPIEVEFINGGKAAFDRTILDFVNKGPCYHN